MARDGILSIPVDPLLESEEPLLANARDPQEYGTLTKLPSFEAQDVDENQANDEEAAQEDSPLDSPVKGIAGIISALLFGEFIGSMDTMLVIAAGPSISSEFQRFQDVSWLSTSYVLSVCVTQPLVGKLSDIFGRKETLLISYLFFAAGNFICGAGYTMDQVILGRVISGLGGGAMMTMSSVVLADLVPKREIAAWRGYINLSLTLGRSLGGPIGGFLTDAVGWRWSFLFQAPLMLVQTLIVFYKFHIPPKDENGEAEETTLGAKFKRIDFLGSILISVSILSAMLLMEMGGQRFEWASPIAITLGVVAIITGVLFIITETYIAPEPIFTLRLLVIPDVICTYLMTAFGVAAQGGMQFFVPLYFQVTKHASPTEAGAHLVPAVVGNALGGLFAGYLVKRTGRYKILLISSGLLGAIAYTLLFLRWNGNTNFWESLYVMPGGFGSAITQVATFVCMTSAIKPEEIAMATSGMYLFLHIGIIAAFSGNSAVLNNTYRRILSERLTVPNASEIIEKSLSDTSYIYELEGKIRDIVISTFVTSIHKTHLISLACAMVAFVSSIFIKSRQL